MIVPDDFKWDNILELQYPYKEIPFVPNLRLYCINFFDAYVEEDFGTVGPDIDLNAYAEWLERWKDGMPDIAVKAQERWDNEANDFVESLKKLGFVEDAGINIGGMDTNYMRSYDLSHHEGKKSSSGFRVKVKEEYYDHFFARKFGLEDFPDSRLITGLAYHVPRPRVFANETREMTIILKESGIKQAEAAAEHFKTLPFIEWARVDY